MVEGSNQDALQKNYRFQVALSYAGEQREYVEAVRTNLQQEGIRVFYDRDHEVELWGTYLVEYFEKIYSKESEYCIIFVSSNYAEKAWPNFELKAALSRQIKSKGKYILPVQFDKTKLPGLDENIGYISAKRRTPEEIATFLIQILDGGPNEWEEYEK